MPAATPLDQPFSLHEIERDQAKFQRFQQLKARLERFAQRLLNGPDSVSIEATDLVNEAFAKDPHTEWKNETHFLKNMYVRIGSKFKDYLKRRNALKRPQAKNRASSRSLSNLVDDAISLGTETDKQRLYSQLSATVFLKLFDTDPPDLTTLGEHNPELFHRLLIAFDRLYDQNPQHAKVIWYRVIGEYSWEEVAMKMDRSKSMVSQQYWKPARQQLRDLANSDDVDQLVK